MAKKPKMEFEFKIWENETIETVSFNFIFL